MSIGKKEIEKRLSKVQRDYERVLEQKRLEWFQHICREARDTYGFGSLGELIAFIFDHASDIQLKEGKDHE
jgi:hypothetical protein